MNTQITKPKNTPSASSIENRLAKLEKAMEIIAGLADNNKQKPATNGGNVVKSDFLAQLTKLSVATIANQQTTNNYPIKNNKSSNNNVLLSGGQMIAELATAILKANKRNS